MSNSYLQFATIESQAAVNAVTLSLGCDLLAAGGDDLKISIYKVGVESARLIQTLSQPGWAQITELKMANFHNELILFFGTGAGFVGFSLFRCGRFQQPVILAKCNSSVSAMSYGSDLLAVGFMDHRLLLYSIDSTDLSLSRNAVISLTLDDIPRDPLFTTPDTLTVFGAFTGEVYEVDLIDGKVASSYLLTDTIAHGHILHKHLIVQNAKNRRYELYSLENTRMCRHLETTSTSYPQPVLFTKDGLAILPSQGGQVFLVSIPDGQRQQTLRHEGTIIQSLTTGYTTTKAFIVTGSGPEGNPRITLWRKDINKSPHSRLRFGNISASDRSPELSWSGVVGAWVILLVVLILGAVISGPILQAVDAVLSFSRPLLVGIRR